MNERKSETPTFFIEPVAMPPIEELRAIRSVLTHRLLAYRCDQGLLFFDRQSRRQHLVTWEEMQSQMK